MHLKTTFFNEDANLNDTAMMEYGLNKDGNSSPTDMKNRGCGVGHDKASKTEYMIKFDSQGKKMKLKRTYPVHGTLERYGDCVKYSEANFHESTLIT